MAGELKGSAPENRNCKGDSLIPMRAMRMVGFTAGALVGGVSAAAAYGSVAKSSQLFGPTVYRGPGCRKSVALTFDDGPSESTPQLLDYLAAEGIKATFFQCGLNVRRLPHIAGDVAAGCHQIGNHTYSHPHLPFKSREFIQRQFTETQAVIEDETGITPMLLRAPYGFRWWGMREVQERLALLSVMWTVIGRDWRWPAWKIAEHVSRRVLPGGIICLHDGRGVIAKPDIGETLKAVREIVPRLRDQGYKFETVSEILAG
jgi:peptidoglycan/xylan/chitin deacetylase (PgdA/CDA1 family)